MNAPLSSPASPPFAAFDAAADAYDAGFTHRRLGGWLRRAVWRQLVGCFQPGQTVLELGCGTGEDACWLARRGVHVTATDASPRMLHVARAKLERQSGLRGRVHTARLDLAAPTLDDDLARIAGGMERRPGRAFAAPFDGVLSNFGALNCLADRRPLATALARVVRPGGRIVLVVMGPACPWEIAWHLAHGDPRTAFRRFRAGVVAHVGGGQTVRVWYPSPGRLHRELAPHFRPLALVGLGVWLPPSHLGGLVESRPRLFRALARLDRRLGTVFPSTWLNDHYLTVLERC
jgi:SAM-dependent methyltransferase